MDSFDPEVGITKGDVVRKTEHLCRKYQVRVPAYIAFLIRLPTGLGTGRDVQDMIEYVLQTMFEGVKGGGKWGTIHPFFDRVGRALRLPCVDSFTTVFLRGWHSSGNGLNYYKTDTNTSQLLTRAKERRMCWKTCLDV